MKKGHRSVLVGSVLVALLGCLFALNGQASATATDNRPTGSLPAQPGRTLLVFGDSLSAAYGMDVDRGWVRLLEKKLAKSHPDWRVVNVSISGETTAGGLARLDGALSKHKPDLVFLELGANDGLSGLPLDGIRGALDSMIGKILAQSAGVLLFEMQIPPNYGPLYTGKFQQIFQQLAKQHNVPMMPFFLDGVAGNPKLTQSDGIHPLAEAQPKIVENVWPVVAPLLK